MTRQAWLATLPEAFRPDKFDTGPVPYLFAEDTGWAIPHSRAESMRDLNAVEPRFETGTAARPADQTLMLTRDESDTGVGPVAELLGSAQKGVGLADQLALRPAIDWTELTQNSWGNEKWTPGGGWDGGGWGGWDGGGWGGWDGGGWGGGWDGGGWNRFPVLPGQQEITFTHDGIPRPVIIDVPESFDPNNPGRYPVVFVFHGGNAAAAGLVRTGMADAGETEEFITVYPSAVDGFWSHGSNNLPYDDVGFVLALVNELVTNWNADADAVFATGHSQGGYFTQYLADQAPDVFAAYGVVAAGMPALKGANQTEDEPMVFFHSTGDPLVPYEGWNIGFGAPFGGAEDTVDHWAQQNNTSMGDYVLLPDTADDGMTTSLSVSEDGTIEHYVTDGDSHGWPGTGYWDYVTREVTYDINATDIIVDFFADYGL